MENLSMTSELVALDDSELDAVAGGCSKGGYKGGSKGGYKGGYQGGGSGSVDVSVVEFNNNVIQAGGDINIFIDN